MPSLSSGSSSRSNSTLSSSAVGVAVRPGPFDDEGYYVGDAEIDIQTNNSCNPFNKQSKGVPCLFGFLGCIKTFTNVEWWNEHCKSHFQGKAPPKQLRCPYTSCAWTTSTQDGEDAWNQRWEHFDQEHDVLSNGEALREEPDVPLFQYLWNVRLITDVQLQELRRSGRLGVDSTPFAVPGRPDRCSRVMTRR